MGPENEETLYQQARAALFDPPKVQPKTRFFVISLAVFIFAVVLRDGSGLVDLAILVGVILVHELGHAAAMLGFGYRDVRIFFIPLIGAAAAGRRRDVARWKQALVMLAGPMPGIVAGFVIALVAPDVPVVHTIAIYLVGLNVLNLLPMSILDGGQLFGVLLFSRRRELEIGFVAVSS